MLIRLLSYLIFWLLMTLIILGSILVIVCLYLPFVAIKAAGMGLSGKLAGTNPESSLPAHKDAQDPAVRPADEQSGR